MKRSDSSPNENPANTKKNLENQLVQAEKEASVGEKRNAEEQNTSPEARAKAKQAAYAAKWKALEAAEAEKAEKDTDTEEDSRDFGGFPSDISLGHNLGCTPERKKRRD